MFRFPGFATAFATGVFAICAAQAQPFPAHNDYARAAVAGVLPLVITAGAPDPAGKVPAINAVKGSKVTNISLSIPLGGLLHGGFYVIAMATQNTNFKGTCKTSYKIVQGGKTLLSGAINSGFACDQGNAFVWDVVSGKIPNSPGAATLVGVVQYGSKTATISVPVVIV